MNVPSRGLQYSSVLAMKNLNADIADVLLN